MARKTYIAIQLNYDIHVLGETWGRRGDYLILNPRLAYVEVITRQKFAKTYDINPEDIHVCYMKVERHEFASEFVTTARIVPEVVLAIAKGKASGNWAAALPGYTDGNALDMTNAPLYRSKVNVIAVQLPMDITLGLASGHQHMMAGAFLIIDPSTNKAWGCDADRFAETYDPVNERTPGLYCKTRQIRAVMVSRCYVWPIDKADHPEISPFPVYLVETVTEQGDTITSQDRYFIKPKEFEQKYESVD